MTTAAVNIPKPELFYHMLVILLSFSTNVCSFPNNLSDKLSLAFRI